MRLAIIAFAVTLGVLPPAAALAEVQLPPPGGYDPQLGGAYEPKPGVTTVTRDRHEKPASGLYSICYINAFQTQDDEAPWWRKNHPALLLKDRDGRFVADPNWPGEMILDTATREKREAIFAIMAPWIRRCAESGFNAIELDNLDTFTRTKGALTAEDNLGLALLLIQLAHDLGLAAAQKNSSDLGPAGKRLAGFDFAVAEECEKYDECEAYIVVYGDRFIEIEYTDNDRAIFERACEKRGERISVVLRDRDLVPPDQKGHHFETC